MADARSSEHALRSAPVRATARGAHRPNPSGSGHKGADIPPNWVLCHLRRRVRYSALGLREKHVIFNAQNAEQGVVWTYNFKSTCSGTCRGYPRTSGQALRAGSWFKGRYLLDPES